MNNKKISKLITTCLLAYSSLSMAGVEDIEKCKAIDKNNEKSLLVFCQLAANDGDPFGQYVIGETYLNGRVLHKDKNKAIYWLKKSAANGLDLAYERLGYVYSTKEFEIINEKRALDYYETAATKGLLSAMRPLGEMLIKGQGSEKDKVMGYAWIYLGLGDKEDAKTIEYIKDISKDMSEEQKQEAMEYAQYLYHNMEEGLH